MKKILDYNIIEKTTETRDSINYRCVKDDTGEIFIIKIFKTRNPLPSSAARFKREYERIMNARVDGVLKIYDIINNQNDFGIVLEDFNGVPLREIIDVKKLSIDEFLRLSVRISEIIGDLHKNDIIHGNIRPNSILVDDKLITLKLSDFSAYTILANLNTDIHNQDIRRNILPYMSPEQTGRINRAVDYRTDLYSLGITFYEALTGVVPFMSSDPLEIIHSQIARPPENPHDIDYNIPEVIAEIIIKLLSKNADDRYQNCYGLMSDLIECRKQYESYGSIKSFHIGGKDIPVKYIPPKELIGRKREINSLIESFKRVSGGYREITFVPGPPGIGKTVLINEMYRPVAISNGYFISGKYNQLSMDIPYSGIIAAFNGLIRQVLSENREKIDEWRVSILNALSPNCSVITSIIPDLELIIGAQAPVPELGTEETRNRFNLYFEKFVNVFTKADHPVMLFLDDIHWADPPSLTLINNLILSADIKYLFIICAYREGPEISNGGLLQLIEKLENQDIKINRIKLAPLSEKNIIKLTMSLLKSSEEDSELLAEIILKKTGGNPFFINQFLQTVYNDKLLSLVPNRGWMWDIDKINKLEVTENVVGLLTEKIKGLPPCIMETLKVCSCLVGMFDLETVALVLNRAIGDVLDAITQAIDGGYVSISGEYYKFQHDKIRETAYYLIDDEEKPVMHYRIGKIIYDKSGDEIAFQNNLFLIVDQLNFGSKIIIEKNEERLLARLNLKAGEKAVAANAHEPALAYFKSGIDILKKISWDDDYDLHLKLHESAAEASSMCGDFNLMNDVISRVIENARSIADKIFVYETRIKSYNSQNKPSDSMIAGLNLLSELGLHLPGKPNKLHILISLLKLKYYLFGRKVEGLINQPAMAESRLYSILRIISITQTAAFVCDPPLYTIMIIEAAALSIRYGMSPFTALPYATYGVILCGIGDIKNGCRFGEIALRLLDRPDSIKIKTKTLLIVNSFIFHWKNHAAEQLERLKEAYASGLETGDFEYTAISALGITINLIFTSNNLLNTLQDISFYSNSIARLNQQTYLNYNNIMKQGVLNMVNCGIDNCRFSGEAYDEEYTLPLHFENKDNTALCLYYMNKTYLNFIFEKYADAYKNTVENMRYIVSMLSSVPYVFSIFIDSLVRLSIMEKARGLEKIKISRAVKKNQKKMKKWASHAPMNYKNMYHLVEAEIARIAGRKEKAEKHYEMAIELSMENKYLIIEALSNELAAKYYIGTGRVKIGKVYMLEAHYCYTRWGAAAKAVHIEEKYKEFFKDSVPGNNEKLNDFEQEGTTSSVMDISTIIKASQAISGEIELTRLLKKMIGIIMENAGADKCFLILEEKGKLYIQAEGNIGNSDIPVWKSIPAADCSRLSAQIVNYVERTGETLILENASQDDRFMHDPYVIDNKPKSVLCKPIINQSKLLGILYLENNLTVNVFTEERANLLKILSTQAAISIENARLIALEREKSELEKEYKEVKFKVLQDRMSPHFLFNSLNSIISLMRTDVETASRAVFMLADNYRFLMDEASKSLIPFDRAWDFAKNYLQMEKLRFNDILSIEIEKNGDFSDIAIPPLIIQPLLENVLKHGDIFKKGDGYIKLSAVRSDNDVLVEIIDNGNGLKSEDIYSRTLGNILNRIKIFNNDSELTVRNREGGGVRASIKLVFNQDISAGFGIQKVVDNPHH